METTHCLRRHGYIILFLVIFVSSVPCFDSMINGSYNARDIKIHSDRKPVLSSSESGGSNSPPKIHCDYKPGPENTWAILCFPGSVINKIKFADYGQPTGDCETLKFKRGNCGAPATLRLVKKNCIGKQDCYFPLSEEMFGPTHCKGSVSFAILYTCAKKKSSLKD